jgi:hypothetical protein
VTDAHMLAFANKFVGHGSGQTDTAPGIIPAIPKAPVTPVPAAAAIAQAAFVTAVRPAAEALIAATSAAPGLGNNSDPVSPAMNKALVTIANIDNQVLGSLSIQVLGNL